VVEKTRPRAVDRGGMRHSVVTDDDECFTLMSDGN